MLKPVITRIVDPTARVMTDEWTGYQGITNHFSAHETVNHSKKEYARGDVTTNTVEGFFAIFKRGLYGTFHSVSPRHLHRYVEEFAFRYNHRKDDDGQRTVEAIQSADGVRLTRKDYLADR